jgi:thymidylate synthase
MKQYLDLLSNIINNGVEKESGRANMPNTIGISHAVIQMDMKDGFPLLTTKKMHWKGIVHELLWFLRGETNIKYLVENNCNIWNSDAFRWYIDIYVTKWGAPKLTIEEFIEKVKAGAVFLYTPISGVYYIDTYTYGDLGKVYGYQWRKQNGVDQVKDVIDGLRDNPYSRYHIIDNWNKADFKEMASPPCHLLYQFIVRPLTIEERIDYHFNVLQGEIYLTNDDDEEIMYLNAAGVPKFYLDLNMYQRSVDSALGAPFNLASMSLLLMMFAKASNMIAGVSTWIGGDTHIYLNQIDGVKEQLKRVPYKLPQMVINKELNSLEDILLLTIGDFELIDYVSHPTIKFELSVGLKK